MRRDHLDRCQALGSSPQQVEQDTLVGSAVGGWRSREVPNSSHEGPGRQLAVGSASSDEERRVLLTTGLPESMLRAATGMTWYKHVLGYVDKRWPGAAAHTRKSMLEALGSVTAALVLDRPNKPEFADLYSALVRYALPPGNRKDERPLDAARILRWLESASIPLVALEDKDLVELALTTLALRLDGKAAAATVARRKRAVFYHVLDAASTGKGRILTANPLNTMKWKPPEAAEKVDRRVVANPHQARELLTALSYVGGLDQDRGRRLIAMFACMYYAALRPAEVVNLRKADCELPRRAGAPLRGANHARGREAVHR